MKINFKTLSILVLFLFIELKVNAAVYTWIGGNNANFYAGYNFSPNRLVPFDTDTIIISGGYGGDTILAETNFYYPTGYYFFQFGVLMVKNGKSITFNCKANTNIYTACLDVVGVAGKTLQIDSNCQLNIYSNSNSYICCFATINFGNISTETESIINGKLTYNTVFGRPNTTGYDKTFYLLFKKNKVIVNGSIEILSDSINLNTNGRKNYIDFFPNYDFRSKVILNGDLVYKGGRASLNIKDSSLQVQPTGRVILSFPSNATEHNLKGIYLPGSQVVINSHPGSDTALINLPDSIYHLIVNSNGNSKPIYFAASANYNNSPLPVLIKGNVVINNSGTSYVEFNHPDSNKTATIEGNLTLNGGGLQIRNFSNSAADSGSRLYIHGNYLQNGGSLNFIGLHPKVGQLFVKGNFYQYGGAIKNTSGSLYPQIVFNGNTLQTLRLRSNIDDSITFVFNNTAGFVLDSNLVLGTGSTINFISGSFSGAGTVIYASPTSSLMFANSNPGTASNTLWSNTVVPYNVILNNSAPISLPASRTVARSLTMGQGILDLPVNDSLIIGTLSNPGVVSQNGMGRIRGKMSVWIGTNIGTYLFPVGSASKTKPIQLEYTTAPNTGGTLSVGYVSAAPGNLGLPLTQGSDSIFTTIDDGYWTINSSNGLGAGTYKVRAFGNNVSGVSQYQKLALLKRSNSSSPWSIPGVHIAPVGKNDSFYVARSGLTGFSDFAISKSVTKILDPAIENNTIGSSQSLCAGLKADTISGSIPTNGLGIFSYYWIQSTVGANGPFMQAIGVNNNRSYVAPILNISTWYRRIVYSGNATDTSNVVFVKINQRSNVGYTINKQTQCYKGNQFIFTDTSNGDATRLWKYGNGNTSNAAILVVDFPLTAQNIETIKLIKTSTDNCVDSFSNEIYLLNNPITKPIEGDSFVRYLDTHIYQVEANAGSNYSWNFSNGSGSSTSNSIQIKWNALGSVQLKLIETAQNGCKGDTVFKSIRIINNVIGSDQIICNGIGADTLKTVGPLNESVESSYLWLQSVVGANGPFVQATGINNNRNYSPFLLNTSTWYKRVLIAGADKDTSNTIFIKVNNRLKVGFTINKQTQCFKGNQFVFTDTTIGNTTRLWKYGSGETSGDTSLVLSFGASQGNVHTIKLVATDGICIDSFSNTVHLIINPVTKPITGDSIVHYLDSTVYSVEANDSSSFHWSFTKGVGNSNTRSIKIKWTSIGETQIKLLEVAANGCMGDTIYKDVSISPLIGIENKYIRDINVYPNPTDGLFNLSNFNQKLDELKLYDNYGNEVNFQKVKVENEYIQIDISNLNDGIYFLYIQTYKVDIIIKKIQLIRN